MMLNLLAWNSIIQVLSEGYKKKEGVDGATVAEMSGGSVLLCGLRTTGQAGAAVPR